MKFSIHILKKFSLLTTGLSYMQLTSDNQLYKTILYVTKITDFKMPNIKTLCHLNSGANKIAADVMRPTLLKLREVLQGHFNCKENN